MDGDTNGSLDIFVNDRETGATTRTSLTGRGLETNGPSRDSTVSKDGRFVAFESEASNLVARDNNGIVDVFVRDRGAGDPSAALGKEQRTVPGDSLPKWVRRGWGNLVSEFRLPASALARSEPVPVRFTDVTEAGRYPLPAPQG